MYTILKVLLGILLFFVTLATFILDIVISSPCMAIHGMIVKNEQMRFRKIADEKYNGDRIMALSDTRMKRALWITWVLRALRAIPKPFEWLSGISRKWITWFTNL